MFFDLTKKNQNLSFHSILHVIREKTPTPLGFQWSFIPRGSFSPWSRIRDPSLVTESGMTPYIFIEFYYDTFSFVDTFSENREDNLSMDFESALHRLVTLMAFEFLWTTLQCKLLQSSFPSSFRNQRYICSDKVKSVKNCEANE